MHTLSTRPLQFIHPHDQHPKERLQQRGTTQTAACLKGRTDEIFFPGVFILSNFSIVEISLLVHLESIFH